MEREAEEDLKFTNKDMEREAEEDLKFTYNLMRPLFRPEIHESWFLIEKGSQKENNRQQELSYDTINSALFHMREHIRTTPCKNSDLLNDMGFQIILKKELEQKTNSIKARGVVYSLLRLPEEQKRKGVVTISTGNFAHILSYFGKHLSRIPDFKEGNLPVIPVTVVMPTSTPDEIKNICKNLGALVIDHGIQNMIQAHDEALEIAQEKGLVYIDSNDEPNMIIGESTLGIELVNNVPDVDAILLPSLFQGCGLTVGLAVAIKGWDPEIEVIEVCSSVLDPLVQNIRERTTDNDELNIPVTMHSWHLFPGGILEYYIDTSVTVNETQTRTATDLLLRKENINDTGAAVCLAAILSGKLDNLKGKRIVIPLFGKIEQL